MSALSTLQTVLPSDEENRDESDESNFIDDFPVPIPTGRCQSYGMFVTSCLRPSKLLFVPAPSDCDIGI